MKPRVATKKSQSNIPKLSIEILQGLPPFQEIREDLESLSLLSSLGRLHSLLPGQVALKQGEEVTEVSIILKGKVQVIFKKEAVDPIFLGPGRTIGEISFFNNTPSTARIAAIEKTDLLSFSKQALRELVEKDKALGLKLYRGLVSDTIAKLESMTDHFLTVKPSSYHQLISLFTDSFQGLSKNVSAEEIEYLSGLIYQVMSAKNRLYHRPEHILEICIGASPLVTLALIFHDAIYAQVDKRLHPLLKPYLEDFELSEDTSISLPSLQKETTELRVVREIFGFKAEDPINTQHGLNEFLSATLAARILRKYLSTWEVIQIACCIEATIPFRAPDASGRTCSEKLLERLLLVIKNHNLKKTKADAIQTIHLAVEVANRDVNGFAAEHTGTFIAQTWNLILEGNPIFRNPLYTVRHYREALQRIRKFHSDLPVQRIFRQFQGLPKDQELANLLHRSKVNRAIQDEYLRISMLALGLLEAVSQLTGGDAPYMLFMGDPAQGIAGIERNLGPIQENGEKNPVVLALLKFGRTQTTPFDFKNSPLAAFLYESLDQESLFLTLERNEDFLEGRITPMQFLKSLKKSTLSSILHAISELAISRRVKILQLAKDILA